MKLTLADSSSMLFVFHIVVVFLGGAPVFHSAIFALGVVHPFLKNASIPTNMLDFSSDSRHTLKPSSSGRVDEEKPVLCSALC